MFKKASGQNRVLEISPFYCSVFYYGLNILILHFNFNFKMSFSKNLPFVIKKAYVL
jgi:hypothetical protein